MSTKAELLNQLEQLGIATPKTWSGSLSDAIAHDWQANSTFYCRAEVTQEKITVVAPGHSLSNQLTKAAPGTTRWAIQPLHDFDVSGAIFLSAEGDYLESVWGSAIGLLRDGLLAYREYKSLNAEGSRSWLFEQEYQLRYANATLVRQPVNLNSSRADEELRRRPQSLISLLKSRGVSGLLEWGSTADTALVLDWKPFLPDGGIIMRLSNLITREPRPALIPDHVRPNLHELTVPLPERCVFDHGARLNHLITRTLADHDCEVLFRY